MIRRTSPRVQRLFFGAALLSSAIAVACGGGKAPARAADDWPNEPCDKNSGCGFPPGQRADCQLLVPQAVTKCARETDPSACNDPAFDDEQRGRCAAECGAMRAKLRDGGSSGSE